MSVKALLNHIEVWKISQFESSVIQPSAWWTKYIRWYLERGRGKEGERERGRERARKRDKRKSARV
tara:strand:- start:46 stop:243 length:198 start_codon:yes stop_codon:yes gene_type:complete